MLLFYTLSLGFYPNYAQSYYIILHVSGLWAAAAGVAVFAIALGHYRRKLAGIVDTAGVVAVAILAVALAWDLASKPIEKAFAARLNGALRQAPANVSYTDYLREVSSTLPVRARPWGS